MENLEQKIEKQNPTSRNIKFLRDKFQNDSQMLLLLSREEAANILGVSSKTLANWTPTGRYNLPMVKVGRLVKYRLKDLEQFIEDRTITE